MFTLSSGGLRLPAPLSPVLVPLLLAVATVVTLAAPATAVGTPPAGAAAGAMPATAALQPGALRVPARVARLNWRGLARCESSNNPRAVNPAGYFGLYQFNVPTWHSVGGRGYPHRASAPEQTYRAQRLYMSRGRSPWPNCGRFL